MPRYSKGGSTKSRRNKRYGKGIIILIAVLIVIIAAVLITLWFVKPELYHKFLGVGEHSWSNSEITAATCTEDGSVMKYCLVCGDVDIRVLPADGHKWGAEREIEKATCGKAGKGEKKCDVCGDTLETVIRATGNHNFGGNGICLVCGFDKNENVSIHFLELGNKYTGDCTLIKYGNTEVLIDAGSRQNSAATIKNYVDEYCTDGILEYVIATHAHQDHIAGFVGNKSGDTRTGILYQYQVGTLIQFARSDASTQIYRDYCTAVEYVKSRGTEVYTALECWNNDGGAQRQYYLDGAQTVSMNILYNYFYENKADADGGENEYSVCMLLTQELQNVNYNYLFTGDLEEKGEEYLVQFNSLPEVDLFKGGHHGSYTASTETLLSVIKPKNVAVCCCCGTTEYKPSVGNEFPAQAFIDRVARYTANIYCTTLWDESLENGYTSMNGNIVFYTEAGELKLRCSNNTVILKNTEWFRDNRVWPEYGK